MKTKIEMIPTSARYEFSMGDESGYRFQIVANLDSEWGWQAHVSLSTFGLKTQDNAIDNLLPAAKHLVRMLEERSIAAPGEGQNG